MQKVAIVYWSQTGNTETMAEAIAVGAKEAGAETTLYTTSEFDPSLIETYDTIAFGCPAMGDEVLEEDEFEPLFDQCKERLKGKKIALFGSYDWGDGEWMRIWEETCKTIGANLICESLIIQNDPDQEGVEVCKAMGEVLARS